ncbi:MAG TPA: hypothetical protein DEO84_07280 [candidate division Zixibacteria bacterium]|jgi:hypothetical protein|nr:hypothetical protein [candidate division Zixibacteria bacterium]HBZ01106.1 hypothetical protein [candidate division Zixibacteria bacterium]
MKFIIALLLFIGLLVAIGIVTVGLIPLKPFLPAIAILEFGIVVYGIFWWLARKTVYQCEHCNRYFALSPISNIMAIKGFDTRLVRCPACGQSNYDKSFPRKEVQAEIIEPGQVKPSEDENWRGFYIQLAVVSIIYLIFVVMFIFLWRTTEGFLNLSSQFLLDIQGGIFAKLTAISALYALYLAIFIAAIRHRYKTGMYTVLTVIISMVFLIVLIIEYSHIKFIDRETRDNAYIENDKSPYR